MARLSYSATKRLKDERSKRIEEFDSVVLEDWMHTVDDGDELVKHYVEAIANAEYACDEADRRYGFSDEPASNADDAIQALSEALEKHYDVLVAEVCAKVAQREGEWTGWRNEEEIEPAVHEAREWLQTHSEAAERAGVWDEVCA